MGKLLSLKLLVLVLSVSGSYLTASGHFKEIQIAHNIGGEIHSLLWSSQGDRDLLASVVDKNFGEAASMVSFDLFKGIQVDVLYTGESALHFALNHAGEVIVESKPIAYNPVRRVSAQIGSRSNVICFNNEETKTSLECSFSFEIGMLRSHPYENLFLATLDNDPSRFVFITLDKNKNKGYDTKYFELADIQYISDVSWSPDGAFIAFIGSDGMVEIFDAYKQKIVSNFKSPFADNIVNIIKWVPYKFDKLISNNVPMMVTSGPKGFYLWNALSGEMISFYEGVLDVQAMEFSPDGQRLALGLNRSVCILNFYDFIVSKNLFGSLMHREYGSKGFPQAKNSVKKQRSLDGPSRVKINKETGEVTVSKETPTRRCCRDLFSFNN